MDAMALPDEQRQPAFDGVLADRYQVCRVPMRRPSRTAKSCGPDSPTLESSLADDREATVANKPGAPRRARSSR